jgi:hypothetical protein
LFIQRTLLLSWCHRYKNHMVVIANWYVERQDKSISQMTVDLSILRNFFLSSIIDKTATIWVSCKKQELLTLRESGIHTSFLVRSFLPIILVLCIVFLVLFVFFLCPVHNVAYDSRLYIMLPVTLDCTYCCLWL